MFCGWHNYGTEDGVTYKFAWIGIPPSTCTCFAQKTSPNGDAAVDAAVSVIAHELVETATDPTGGGWCYTASSSCMDNSPSVENADQCAWYFPNAIFKDNSFYNIKVGERRYYIQANWNLAMKTCAMF